MDDGVFKPTTKGTPQGGVISPLLANIVLNYLDWQLHANGFKFVRYADDIVITCKTLPQTERALDLVKTILSQDLDLQLSPEKTKVTTFGKGYAFLGFQLSSFSRKMRPKAVEKFKDKIRALTCRKHNLDAESHRESEPGHQGNGKLLCDQFSTSTKLFLQLDPWIRMRIRCMKFKRKKVTDNYRFRIKVLCKLGLLSLTNFCRASQRT